MITTLREASSINQFFNLDISKNLDGIMVTLFFVI